MKDVYLSKDEFISGVITQAKLTNTTNMKTFVSNSNFTLQLMNHLPVNSRRPMTLLLDFFKNILGKATLFLWITFTPYLFYELKKIQTGAVGTLDTTRKGVPKGIRDAVLTKKKVIQKLCHIYMTFLF